MWKMMEKIRISNVRLQASTINSILQQFESNVRMRILCPLFRYAEAELKSSSSGNKITILSRIKIFDQIAEVKG